MRILTALFVFILNGQSQTAGLAAPTAYFSAIIVTDIDTSIAWYTRHLGFELLKRNEFTAQNIRQANLKTGDILIELIEAKGKTLNSAELRQREEKRFSSGYFKFGLKLKEFDAWVKKLRNEGVDFYGDVVTDPLLQKRMVIIKDPDGNYLQLFEN
ncbi:MAG: VOC family protein [Calditrichaeota bacterium]|nr:VOC family protein [Calditrichota bacterium]